MCAAMSWHLASCKDVRIAVTAKDIICVVGVVEEENKRSVLGRKGACYFGNIACAGEGPERKQRGTSVFKTERTAVGGRYVDFWWRWKVHRGSTGPTGRTSKPEMSCKFSYKPFSLALDPIRLVYL